MRFVRRKVPLEPFLKFRILKSYLLCKSHKTFSARYTKPRVCDDPFRSRDSLLAEPGRNAKHLKEICYYDNVPIIPQGYRDLARSIVEFSDKSEIPPEEDSLEL